MIILSEGIRKEISKVLKYNNIVLHAYEDKILIKYLNSNGESIASEVHHLRGGLRPGDILTLSGLEGNLNLL
jgi:hypothetical protein